MATPVAPLAIQSEIPSSEPKKARVLVAMSGGVDSSVAAYLLQKEGYEVIGVTFQLYDYSRINRKEGKGGCCSIEDVQDAREVCSKLGIKHYLFDSRERFQERVVNYFAESYKAGKTPNPCVACNTFIKFDELSYYAKSVGAEFFATGHYAQLDKEGEHVFISAAADKAKDQSYFLMGVSQERLRQCLFPMGQYTKPEVRAIAEEAGLPVSEKPDSMEVCFIPDNNYRNFLQNEFGVKDEPGNFIDEDGKILGQHKGIHHFTIGQRKGLGAYGLNAHYVIRLDPQTKEVHVGIDRSLFSEGLWVENSHFSQVGNYLNRTLAVKIRSRSAFLPVQIVEAPEGKILARFETPQRAVTPGQFAVFYDRNRVLGGGPILKPVANFSHV